MAKSNGHSLLIHDSVDWHRTVLYVHSTEFANSSRNTKNADNIKFNGAQNVDSHFELILISRELVLYYTSNILKIKSLHDRKKFNFGSIRSFTPLFFSSFKMRLIEACATKSFEYLFHFLKIRCLGNVVKTHNCMYCMLCITLMEIDFDYLFHFYN